ncbi:MAG: hypothetical protein ACYCSS_05260 [Sulfuriferula sp.]
MTQAQPSGDYVLTNFRYLSAYNELVARISQRQQTLTLFVAIFTGLVTALIATRDIFKTDHTSIAWLMIGFPFASIALTLLNYKYESLISLLRRYLADLERVKDAHLHFPSYNCDAFYIKNANLARHFHDLTCAALILAYNIVSIGIYIAISSTSAFYQLIICVCIAVIALACVAVHLQLRKIHYVA